MNLLFFQNCVSPHQVPYIKVLAERHEVTLVVPCITTSDRRAMGWTGEVESIEGVRLLVSPTDEQVGALLEGAEQRGRTVCLFSSITGFREVKRWLDISLDYRVRRGIICEAPITYRIPLWMHKIKFVVKDLRYRRYIQYIFAIGEECADYYRGWGSHWRVTDFAYCVEPAGAAETLPESRSGYFDCCFVGSLTHRKNVRVVLEALTRLRRRHLDSFRIVHFTIVGDGPQREMLERMVADNNLEEQVTFVGALPMEEARRVIAANDVLILPSIYDGWGAVVNEALSAGTQVWCSDRCGAKSLVGEEPGLGKVFDPHDATRLARLIWNDHGFFLNKEHVMARRAKIRAWAQQHISPESIARIMEETLSSQ